MNRLLAGVALAAALVSAQVTRAQDVEEKPWTLSAGADVVSAYIFRGFEYEDSGYIVQPWAQFNYSVYQTDDLTITPYVGIWNTVHEREEPGDEHLWETDYYGGVDFAMGDFTLGAIYTLYTAPGDAFEDIQEVGLKLSYDDSALAEEHGLPFALAPYIAWYKEISDENAGGTQDQYGEIGVTPSLPIEDTGLTLKFPIAVGLSVDDYFLDDDGDNEVLGFVSAGAYVYYDLPIDEKYGTWTVYGGGSYYYLNAESLQLASGEDRDYEIMGKVGLSVSY